MSVPHESDYSFQGRSAELALLCDKEQPPYIINVHGESGIGKTSLLREAMKRLRVEPPAACVPVGHCEALRPASDRPQAVHQTLAEQAALTLDRSLDFTNMARGAVTQINLLAKQQPTYLFIDTTEAIQDDKHFWDQIELDLISPLVVTHKVSLVFAGRMPAPLTRFAVRRDLRLVSLTPLSIADDAPAQVAEILRLRRFKAASHKRAVAEATGLVLEFSLGHPGLSARLAEYLAALDWPPAAPGGLRKDLCREIVKPFIEQEFFSRIEPAWWDILWWASVLDWFDATTLKAYLQQLPGQYIPAEIADQPDYFFARGLGQLRISNTVIWREREEDRLSGVLRDVMRNCLRVLNPEGYRQACLAAADALHHLAELYLKDDETAQAQYARQEADYRQRAAEAEARGGK
jgi:hypothetical protein